MQKSGIIKNLDMVKRFFETSHNFGTLSVVSIDNESNPKRVVAEINLINDGQGEIIFAPISDELFSFEKGEVLKGVNEANNIFFETIVEKNHAGKLLTIKIPESYNLTNLRSYKRHVLDKSLLDRKPELVSFGEDGVKKLMVFEGELLDISTNGASFEIEALRIDGFFKNDVVEINASHKYNFLNRLRGKIVHKSLYSSISKDLKKYRIGIKFDKKIDISSLIN